MQIERNSGKLTMGSGQRLGFRSAQRPSHGIQHTHEVGLDGVRVVK